MSRLTRDGTVETVSGDQILRREQGQENNYFPCSADREQDWQPYPVDPYPCVTWDGLRYIHTTFALLAAAGQSLKARRMTSL